MLHNSWKIISILLLTFSLQAEDIDALLGAYEKASELSCKTKDENAGHLIVYTRDDLERMQANTLKDILKSLRFFQYQENRLGQPDIMNVDPITYYSKTVRVYLDEHELLNPIAGSGLILFGDMELDFIDHIEIYQGFPSFDFGVEPATIVIHLYSKTAEHDSGAKVRLQYGSNGSNTQSAYYAQTYDDLSIFSYVSRNDNRRESYAHDSETLRRDMTTERLFVSISNDNHRLQLHGMHAKGDAFMGSLLGAIAESTEQKSSFVDLSLHSMFMNKSLILDASVLYNSTPFSYRYNDPAYLINTDPNTSPIFPLIPIKSLDQTIEEDSYTIGLKKIFQLQDHQITTGLKFRHKHFDLTDAKLVSTLPVQFPPIEQPYYNEDVFSLFIQDIYEVTKQHVISASVMYQHYDRDEEAFDVNLMQFRLGYSYTNSHWVAKTFLSRQEFASEPYMTVSPHYGNANLGPENYVSFSQEISHENSGVTNTALLAYGVNRDIPILDLNTFIMQNSAKKTEGVFASYEWSYLFRENDSLELQAFISNIEAVYENADDIRHYGAMARMLNTVNKFDIFNEFVYRNGYSHCDSSVDYSAGIIYHYSDDLQFNFKGENIFNDGLEGSYINRVDPTTMETTDRVIVPTIEQKFWFGMEYLF
ncbi:MAG: hypothetical protein U9P71_07870 [Campylobacterota bacterium]|nr:hypothetical protein [Campylobacterota bacterium]